MSGLGKGSTLAQWWSSLKRIKFPKLTTSSSQNTYTYLSVIVLIAGLIPFSHSSPINRQAGISENVYITFQNDTSGVEQRVCSIDSMTYEDGESIPTSSACEHCICRPPGFACTIISCEYRPGCKAIKRSNQCCPEYQCECEKDGKIYQNGEKILDDNNPCEVCYCQGGDVICAVIDCYWRSDCQPRYIENRCCPLYDHCPPPSDLGPIRPKHRPTTTTTVSTPISWFNLSSSIYATPTTTKRPTLSTTTQIVPIHVEEPEPVPVEQPVDKVVSVSEQSIPVLHEKPQEPISNEPHIILEIPVPEQQPESGHEEILPGIAAPAAQEVEPSQPVKEKPEIVQHEIVAPEAPLVSVSEAASVSDSEVSVSKPSPAVIHESSELAANELAPAPEHVDIPVPSVTEATPVPNVPEQETSESSISEVIPAAAHQESSASIAHAGSPVDGHVDGSDFVLPPVAPAVVLSESTEQPAPEAVPPVQNQQHAQSAVTDAQAVLPIQESQPDVQQESPQIFVADQVLETASPPVVPIPADQQISSAQVPEVEQEKPAQSAIIVPGSVHEELPEISVAEAVSVLHESSVPESSTVQAPQEPLPPSNAPAISHESSISDAVITVANHSSTEVPVKETAEQPSSDSASVSTPVVESEKLVDPIAEKVSIQEAKPDSVVDVDQTQAKPPQNNENASQQLPEPVKPEASITVVGDGPAVVPDGSLNLELPADIQEVPISVPQDLPASVSEVPVSIPEDAPAQPQSEDAAKPAPAPEVAQVPVVVDKPEEVEQLDAVVPDSPVPGISPEPAVVAPEIFRPNEISSELHDAHILVANIPIHQSEIVESQPVSDGIPESVPTNPAIPVPGPVLVSVSQEIAPEPAQLPSNENAAAPVPVEIIPEQVVAGEPIPIADQKVFAPDADNKTPEPVLLVVDEPISIVSDLPQSGENSPALPEVVDVKQSVKEVEQVVYVDPLVLRPVIDESGVPFELLVKPESVASQSQPTTTVPVSDGGDAAVEQRPMVAENPFAGSNENEVPNGMYHEPAHAHPGVDAPVTADETVTKKQPEYIDPVLPVGGGEDESGVPLEMLQKPVNVVSPIADIPASDESAVPVEPLQQPVVSVDLPTAVPHAPTESEVSLEIIQKPTEAAIVSSSVQTENLGVTYPFADGPFTPAEIITVTPTKAFGFFATVLPTYTVSHSESSVSVAEVSQAEFEQTSQISPSTTIIVLEPTLLVVGNPPAEQSIFEQELSDAHVEATTPVYVPEATTQKISSDAAAPEVLPAEAPQEIALEHFDAVEDVTTSSRVAEVVTDSVASTEQFNDIKPTPVVLPNQEANVESTVAPQVEPVKEPVAFIEEAVSVADEAIQDEPTTEKAQSSEVLADEVLVQTTTKPEVVLPIEPAEIIVSDSVEPIYNGSPASIVHPTDSDGLVAETERPTTQAPVVAPVVVEAEVVDVPKPSQHLEMPIHDFAENQISLDESKPDENPSVEVLHPHPEMLPPVMSHSKPEVVEEANAAVTDKAVLDEQSLSFSSDEGVVAGENGGDDKIPVIVVDMDTGNTETPTSFDSFIKNSQALSQIPEVQPDNKVDAEEVPVTTTTASPHVAPVQHAEIEVLSDETIQTVPELPAEETATPVLPIQPEPAVSEASASVDAVNEATTSRVVPEPIVESEPLSLADDTLPLVENEAVTTSQPVAVPSKQPAVYHQVAEIVHDEAAVTESSTEASASKDSVVPQDQPTVLHNDVPAATELPVFDDKPGNDPEIPEPTAAPAPVEAGHIQSDDATAEVLSDDAQEIPSDVTTVLPIGSSTVPVSTTGSPAAADIQQDEPEQGPIPNDHEYHARNVTTSTSEPDAVEESSESPGPNPDAEDGVRDSTELPVADDSKYRLDLSIFDDDETKEKSDVTTVIPQDIVKLIKSGHKDHESEVGSTSAPISVSKDNEVVFDEPAANTETIPKSLVQRSEAGNTETVPQSLVQRDESGSTETVPQSLVQGDGAVANTETVPQSLFQRSESDAVEVPTTPASLERLIVDQDEDTTALPRHHIPGHAHEEATTEEIATTDVPAVLQREEEIHGKETLLPVVPVVVKEVKISPKFQIPSELVKKVQPITDDLEDLSRSDLSVRQGADNEVAQTEETWFWRTLNRVRTITGLFSSAPPKSSRQPRSTKSAKAEDEASPPYVTIHGKKVMIKNNETPKQSKYWALPRLLLW